MTAAVLYGTGTRRPEPVAVLVLLAALIAELRRPSPFESIDAPPIAPLPGFAAVVGQRPQYGVRILGLG